MTPEDGGRYKHPPPGSTPGCRATAHVDGPAAEVDLGEHRASSEELASTGWRRRSAPRARGRAAARCVVAGRLPRPGGAASGEARPAPSRARRPRRRRSPRLERRARRPRAHQDAAAPGSRRPGPSDPARRRRPARRRGPRRRRPPASARSTSISTRRPGPGSARPSATQGSSATRLPAPRPGRRPPAAARPQAGGGEDLVGRRVGGCRHLEVVDVEDRGAQGDREPAATPGRGRPTSRFRRRRPPPAAPRPGGRGCGGRRGPGAGTAGPRLPCSTLDPGRGSGRSRPGASRAGGRTPVAARDPAPDRVHQGPDVVGPAALVGLDEVGVLVDTSAVPRRRPLPPAASISRPAESPGGLVNTEPALGRRAGWPAASPRSRRSRPCGGRVAGRQAEPGGHAPPGGALTEERGSRGRGGGGHPSILPGAQVDDADPDEGRPCRSRGRRRSSARRRRPSRARPTAHSNPVSPAATVRRATTGSAAAAPASPRCRRRRSPRSPRPARRRGRGSRRRRRAGWCPCRRPAPATPVAGHGRRRPAQVASSATGTSRAAGPPTR